MVDLEFKLFDSKAIVPTTYPTPPGSIGTNDSNRVHIKHLIGIMDISILRLDRLDIKYAIRNRT